MDKVTPRISILTASQPNQISHGDYEHGGVYSGALTERIRNGHSLKQAHEDIQQKGFPESLIESPQTPQSYGAPLPDTVANPNRKNKGTAILVAGQPNDASEKAMFEKGLEEKTERYEGLGYEVKTADTFEEFEKHLSDAKTRGKTEEGDHLIVDSTMHGTVLRSSIKKPQNVCTSSNEANTPQMPNTDPNMESVLLFQNRNKEERMGWRKSHLVHEQDVFKPIVDASQAFDHTVCIFENCFSGAMNEQFFDTSTLRDPKKPIQIEDIHTTP